LKGKLGKLLLLSRAGFDTFAWSALPVDFADGPFLLTKAFLVEEETWALPLSGPPTSALHPAF
jgi:hypothetical protein